MFVGLFKCTLKHMVTGDYRVRPGWSTQVDPTQFLSEGLRDSRDTGKGVFRLPHVPLRLPDVDGLFRLHSPQLRESWLMYFPLFSNMLNFRVVWSVVEHKKYYGQSSLKHNRLVVRPENMEIVWSLKLPLILNRRQNQPKRLLLWVKSLRSS